MRSFSVDQRCLSRFFILVLSTAVLQSPALVGAVSINFDNLPGMPNVIGPVPAASRLTNQYQPTTGAVFTAIGGYASVVNAYNPNFGPNHTISDPNFVAGTNESENLSYRSRVVISFFDPNNPAVPAVTNAVSMRGDRFNYVGASALMEAYDVYGNLLGSSFASDSAAGLTLSINVPEIHKVRISQVAPGAMGEAGGIGLDNLTFNTVAPRYRAGFADVLVTSADAPSDGNGNYTNFGSIRLNDNGQVSYLGFLSGTTGGGNDNVGVYRADENFNVQIDRAFDSGVLGSKKTIPNIGGVAINNAGQVAYQALLTNTNLINPYTNRSVLYRGSGGPLTTIALGSQTEPYGNGKFVTFPDNTGTSIPAIKQLNNAGQVAFTATLSDTSAGGQDDGGIYRGSGGAVTQIDREFTTQVVHYTPHGPADMNSSGQFSYVSTRGYNTPQLDYQLLRGDGATVHTVVNSGESVPNDFGLFETFANPAINEVGNIAFFATISDANLNDQGVFRSNEEGPLTQIARSGQVSPDGVSQIVSFNHLALNDSDHVAMDAKWLSGNKGGILLGNGNFLDAIAQTGQASPDGLGTFANFFLLQDINNAGQVLFYATLTGPGVNGDNNEGLYLADGKNLIQIVREGVLWSPDFSADNFLIGGLNENGQVAYSLRRLDRFSFDSDHALVLYTPPVLFGDFNEDGTVDAADYVVWRDNFGYSGSDFPGDHNNSGVIDMGDYQIWRSHFGQSVITGAGSGAITAAVPEPASSILILSMAACALLQRYRS